MRRNPRSRVVSKLLVKKQKKGQTKQSKDRKALLVVVIISGLKKTKKGRIAKDIHEYEVFLSMSVVFLSKSKASRHKRSLDVVCMVGNLVTLNN